ncbi:MAG: FHA domain-containing protein, partial [Burkholderiales bacterium]|nr:FHA domain-containing protein [Burkholderiales bacterium]
MTLTLLAVALNDQPLSQPIVGQFDAAGGTIGRADHNTMALPDPERHISRLQAEVVARGAGFVIRNVGSANPIVVAGRTLARGEAAVLADGDELRIGGYLLRAQA